MATSTTDVKFRSSTWIAVEGGSIDPHPEMDAMLVKKFELKTKRSTNIDSEIRYHFRTYQKLKDQPKEKLLPPSNYWAEHQNLREFGRNEARLENSLKIDNAQPYLDKLNVMTDLVEFDDTLSKYLHSRYSASSCRSPKFVQRHRDKWKSIIEAKQTCGAL
jgi:hypothetical protein